MRFRKTRWDERGVYRYVFYDEEGVEQSVVLRPGEDGVTEMDVKLLHSLDDAEVYNNVKNSRPPMEDWLKESVAAWRAAHPGEDPDERELKRWAVSLDAEVSGADGSFDGQDSGRLMFELASREEDPMRRVLFEAAEELEAKDQELFELLYVCGFRQAEVARLWGVSPKSVCVRHEKLVKRLKEIVMRMG